MSSALRAEHGSTYASGEGLQRAERRAASKPARVPSSGDRPTHTSAEGDH